MTENRERNWCVHKGIISFRVQSVPPKLELAKLERELM